MRPVLFEVFVFPINSYGVTKALAVIVAAYLIAREFRRLGWDPDVAWNIVVTATILGFAGAKLSYLAENAGGLMLHDLGSSGFTWYGGLLAGVATAVVMCRRGELPVGIFAGIAAAPLSLAYGIGRIGCFSPVTAPTASRQTSRGRWPSPTGRCPRWCRSTRPHCTKLHSPSSWRG